VFDNLKWSFKEPCYPGGSNGKDFGERKFSDFINSYAPSGLPEATIAGGIG